MERCEKVARVINHLHTPRCSLAWHIEFFGFSLLNYLGLELVIFLINEMSQLLYSISQDLDAVGWYFNQRREASSKFKRTQGLAKPEDVSTCVDGCYAMVKHALYITNNLNNLIIVNAAEK